MAHADDATKTWVSAIPTKNSDGNVIKWYCEYKYTLAVSGKDDYVHTFNNSVKIDTPSKAPSSYTKAELLILMDKPHWDDMFNKKYAYHIASQPVITKDTSFDISTLNDS
jgi:hypothetical protein